MSVSEKKGHRTKDMSTLSVKRAYDYIKELSIDFQLYPGSPINENEIASTLNMSRVPVREALNRLVMSHFVTFEHGKGFFCRKFSESVMKDLYDIRFDIEVGSVRDACRVGVDADIQQIVDRWRRNIRLADQLSDKELILEDEAFHLGIAKLGGNIERVNYLSNIMERIRFVRQINMEDANRRNSFMDEHLQLIEAISGRDEIRARQILDYHLGINSKELTDNIRSGTLRIFAPEVS